MATRDRYLITGDSVEAIKTDLNFFLQLIADRLDKLEGIRGKPELSTKGITAAGRVLVNDDDDNELHSFK